MGFENAATRRFMQQFILQGGVEAATLTGALTLTHKSANILLLDPGGSSRDVTLPAEETADGLPFLIKNTANAAENLVIKNDAASTIVTINQDEWAIVACDGTTWHSIPLSALADYLATANMWTARQTLTGGLTSLDHIFAAATELTIASGAIVATQGAHTVDTESDAASDDLDSITGGTAEEVIFVRPANAARSVVLKHAIGANLIACPNGQDITLAEATDFAMLAYNGTQWVVVGANVLAGQPLVGDTVAEKSAGAGVTIDSLLIKDGLVSADFLVKATIAVGNATGASTDAALTLQLNRLDGTTAIASARQVMIIASATQYAPFFATEASLTFANATAGSIVATAAGWALVETDATGAFACTAVNTDDETLYFAVRDAPSGGSDHTKSCAVVFSSSDAAAWSA